MAENQKKGKSQGIPENSRISTIISDLFHKKRMHDICMLLDVKVILEWALHIVNLTAANGPNEGRCASGTHA